MIKTLTNLLKQDKEKVRSTKGRTGLYSHYRYL